MNVVKEIVSRTREYGLKYVLKIIIKSDIKDYYKNTIILNIKYFSSLTSLRCAYCIKKYEKY